MTLTSTSWVSIPCIFFVHVIKNLNTEECHQRLQQVTEHNLFREMTNLSWWE